MMSKLRHTGLLPEEPAMENAEEQTIQSEAGERERREAEEANEREIEAQRNVFLSGGAESCARGSKNCGQNWSGSRERAKVDAADGSTGSGNRRSFPEKIVREDLTAMLKRGANVPTLVLEYPLVL